MFLPGEIGENVSWQTGAITTYYPRGTIYDKNGIPFTNRVDIENNFIPTNDTPSVGSTFTGVTSENQDTTTKEGLSGANGLEYHYNSILTGGNKVTIMATLDALGNVADSDSYVVVGDNINNGCNIHTTTNYHIQKETETLLSQILMEKDLPGGAVLINDVETGEILSMASMGSYLNKTLQSFQPGSIFKIITLAYALEKGVTSLDEEFDCGEGFDVAGQTKYCNVTSGHGKITLKEGFAHSCNYVFYEVTRRFNIYDENDNLIGNELLDFCKDIGFIPLSTTRNINKELILEYEDYYSIIPNEIYNDMDIFNLSLGQGNTQITPLLMNNIITAILNDGQSNYLSIIDTISTQTGTIISEEVKKEYKIDLSKETFDGVKEAMEEVCISGTGANNTMQEYGYMSGKSGTAEHIDGKTPHSWFVGYFPAQNPKYVMSVFIEEGGSGSSSALSLFNEIANKVMEME